MSVAFSVKLLVPATDGVPEMVLPDKLKPVGSEPEDMDQVYVGVPPVAATA